MTEQEHEQQADMENTNAAEHIEAMEISSDAEGEQIEAEVKAEMEFDADTLRPILEALLLSADRPLSIKRMQEILSDGDSEVNADSLRAVLAEVAEAFADRSMELVEVSSGFRFQVKQRYAQWVQRLWEEKPQRYSRALLETLAIIAYRQPITRGEIEEIRGVSVSSTILKTLQERDWVRVVGHRDVPGKPAMFASTRGFLDYFGLQSLDELPTLAELRDIDSINAEFDFEDEKAKQAEARNDDDGLINDETSVETSLEAGADEDTLASAEEAAVDSAGDYEDDADFEVRQVDSSALGEFTLEGGDDEEEEGKSLADIVDGLEERLRRDDDDDTDEDDRP